jgi:cell division transport system permease protein
MREIFTSIRRTPYQSLAAFMVLFFTLFLSTSLLIVLSFLYGFLGYVETRPQVTVYFQQKTSEGDIFKTRDQLQASGKVSTVNYISKEKAFAIYKELNKDNPLLLEMVSPTILPASLEIFAKKPYYLPEIAEFIKKQPGVDEVHFQKDIFDRLLTLTTILRRTTFFLFTFLLVMAIVVLSTTTLFKIALKKDEIELLRLLGASNFYIKKPFLNEGLFFGLAASTISFAVILGVLMYFHPFLSGYLKGVPSLNLLFGSYSLTVWPLNPVFLGLTFVLASVFGMGIAFIASYTATEKYLS